MQQLRFLTEQFPRVTDIGYLLLRVAVGLVFIPHGYGDIFQAGVSTNVENYRGAGIPLPELMAPFAAYVQFFGGLLFLVGFLTRPLALGFSIVMLGALIFVHRGEGLVMGQDGSGSGFAFSMLAASLTLLLTGPGRFSLDALLLKRQGARLGTPTSA